MGTLSISESVFLKFFEYLKKFDNATKIKLISELKDSLDSEKNIKTENNSLYGQWIDDKTSDRIIEEIRSSRVEKKESIFFDEISSRH